MSEQQQQRLYTPPSFQALTTYVSVVVVLFLAGLNIGVFSELDTLKTEIRDLRKQNAEMELALASGYGLRRSHLAIRPVSPTTAQASPAPVIPSHQKAPASVQATPAHSQPAPAIRPTAPKATLAANPQAQTRTSPPRKTTSTPAVVVKKTAPAAVAVQKPTPAAPVGIQLTAKQAPRKNIAATPRRNPEALSALAAPETAPTPVATSPSVSAPSLVQPTSNIPTLSGEILATNPDQRRVIISIGTTAGVENGRRFNIYRNSNWVGDIRVAKVFSDMAMCDIVTPTPRGMRVGDIARFAAATTK